MSSRVLVHPAHRVFLDEQSVQAGIDRIRLAADFSSLDAIEGVTGLTMPEIMRVLSGRDCRLSVGAKVLWGLLRRHHPEVTIEEAFSIMAGFNDAISDAISQLFQRAFNIASDGKSDGKKAEWSIQSFLIEWVKLGGSPSEFWRQTPKSYVVIMEGLAEAATRKVDLCLITAWHTAVFALNGYTGKLKPLSEYLSNKAESEKDERLENARAIHFFHSLKARGVPVEISRTAH